MYAQFCYNPFLRSLYSSPDELTELWKTAEPLVMLERLNREYNAYTGGKDYQRLAKECCKKTAVFLQGDIYQINKEFTF